jgi:hypothetical protein
VDVDEELLNRCIVLSVAEGREQTRDSTNANANAKPSPDRWLIASATEC